MPLKHRSRRHSACHRHPTEPVTGFCALCLRDRLAGLDSPSGSQIEPDNVAVSVSIRRELRRSKSIAGEKCNVLNDFPADPRRNSCDVKARSSLSDLFVVDDTKKTRIGGLTVDLTELGISGAAEAVPETAEEDDDVDDDCREIRVSRVLDDEIEDEDEDMEGDLKTMKEIIEMELIQLKNKKSNLMNRLRNWRQKQKDKKQRRCVDRSTLGQLEGQSEYGLGRRSCDTEPRFSIDVSRLSVEEPRLSESRLLVEEHRASWDGYMMARTIPRLTPMLSAVDNVIVGPVMHSISEDGANGASGVNSSSDSSNSNRGSSSSSMKSSSTKTEGAARVSPASDVMFQGTKLVITEKELKDWHLNSMKSSHIESVSNAPGSGVKTSAVNVKGNVNVSNEQKKTLLSNKWKKVCNLWGNKKNLELGNSNANVNAKVVINPSSVGSRNRRDEFALDRTRNARYSTSDIDSGLLRLYLTPFRNSRRSKAGKRVPSMGINGFQLH